MSSNPEVYAVPVQNLFSAIPKRVGVTRHNWLRGTRAIQCSIIKWQETFRGRQMLGFSTPLPTARNKSWHANKPPHLRARSDVEDSTAETLLLALLAEGWIDLFKVRILIPRMGAVRGYGRTNKHTLYSFGFALFLVRRPPRPPPPPHAFSI